MADPIKVLVVDDNPATLYATSRMLRAAGFEVIEATTGNQALQEVSQIPDIVVLDVNLPDMHGFEVCRKIREKEITARMPVLHLSATFVKDGDKVQGLEAGADAYLTHPVEPPVLVATVNALLRTRQAEDAMRRSEAKFKAIFEQAPNGIALLSQEMVYLEVNPGICQLLGRRRDDIIGRHISTFIPTDHEADVAGISRLLHSTGIWRGSLPHIRAKGDQVELDWNLAFHSVPGVRIAIVTDMTERKRAEAEREQLLASERAARAEAERANRLKDEFLATLSHELRTPLNSIVGWSQILRGGQVTKQDIAEGVESIDRNARAQAQLIDDLLDVARITSGKLRLTLQSTQPAEMVNAALETVIPAAVAKSITVSRDLDKNVGPVMWDPSRMQQVVWNLVNNAVKFTPKGGKVQVDLDLFNSSARIRVRDSGQGIRPDFLPHLFERFRQEDSTTRRGYGGLGLGLAIVKHLVEMHGGTVTADSEGEGLGAVFTVMIPISALREDLPPETDIGSLEAPSAHEQAHAGHAATNLANVRVLVVDDDTDARSLVKRVLIESEADVRDAGSMHEALKVLETFSPNVLISDIGMPLRDGYDLIRSIRSSGLTPLKLPAIALTAFARPEDSQQALAAGYQVHLKKPIQTSILLAKVAELAGK